PHVSANARIFTDIYRTNAWGHPESRSGPGSTLARGTAVRHALLQVLAELRPHTLLDAPCGDFNWMSEVPLPGMRYVGVDVVAELIERNRRLYAGNARRFLTLDMTLEPLPRADLVFCRDGLVHLSFADIFKALAQFRA